MSFLNLNSLNWFQKHSVQEEFCASKQRAFGFSPWILKNSSPSAAKLSKAPLNMHGQVSLHIQGKQPSFYPSIPSEYGTTKMTSIIQSIPI